MIAIFLTNLTNKGPPNIVKWTDSTQQAIYTLKDLLCKRPILKLADFNRTFIEHTDASEDGIGAVFLQLENKEKIPVAYASRKLQARERSYKVIEKECFAVVWGVQKFRQYLYGQEFKLNKKKTTINHVRT